MEQTPNGNRALRWGLALVALLVVAMATFHYSGRGRFHEVFGGTLQRARLVAQMRAGLYAAAEAEKSAVLAETDEASQDFAGRARQGVAQVSAALAQCKALAGESGPEADLLRGFEQAFAEYRKVDEEILAQAVLNTNLKAQALSFAQARQALERMEQALSPLLNAPGGRHAATASRALLEALRIQALHAPHIEEKADARMDELEARMAEADTRARAALAALSGQPGGQPHSAQALAAYEDFHKTTAQITALSRQNTNVRSLALTLERKTRLLAACDAQLKALEDKLQADMAKGTR